MEVVIVISLIVLRTGLVLSWPTGRRPLRWAYISTPKASISSHPPRLHHPNDDHHHHRHHHVQRTRPQHPEQRQEGRCGVWWWGRVESRRSRSESTPDLYCSISALISIGT